ncbi:lysoplasmalogenase [Nocardioides sp. zg-579]|uniref:Lysoplasmalogenase n=2 Tax=Nocardioides marmotae TaxID=2663857 RepID=A0A6I3JH23_9ACTN|nr:lysoplasmalogenase [Gordonia jinghuaiqii]MTB97345.1 lysoplasmalogenase [Nocardioides marmotae]
MCAMSRATTLLPGAAYAALAIADTVAAGTGRRRLRRVLKPALMPTLAAAFHADLRDRGAHPGTRTLRRGTAAAQALSWGGDVALLGTGERALLTGLGSFLGAHVAYIAAFSSVRGDTRHYDTAGLKVALGAWATLAPLTSVAAGRRDPALRGPVAAYATILAAMFASSRMLDPALPPEARRRLQAGTALFLLSDSVLAAQMFLLREPRPALEAVVMATYTASQGLIAAGVARAT